MKKGNINGLHVDDIDSLKKEILSNLKIKADVVDFEIAIRDHVNQLKGEQITMIWSNYDVSLMKIRGKLSHSDLKEFNLSYGSNMMFDAVNRPLNKTEQLEFNRITEKMEIIKKEMNDMLNALGITIKYK